LESNIQKDIDTIALQLSKVKEILATVLYGSCVRGDAGPRSDIDVLVIFNKEKNMRMLETKVSDLLHNKTRRFVQPVCVSLDHMGDPGLLARIFREGKVLFAKKPLLLHASTMLDTTPQRIFTFSLAKLTPKNKWLINTALYGKTVSGYNYRGILEVMGGKKLGAGVIMVPEQSAQRIIDFFERYKIKPKEIKIWAEET